MKLYDKGVYLVNGLKIVEEGQEQLPLSKEEASKNTIAYGILKDHNTSGNMEKLQIKFEQTDLPRYYFCGNHTDSPCVRVGEISSALCVDELPQFSVCGGWHH